MFVQCSYNGQKFIQYCTNLSGRLYEHCTNFFGYSTSIVRTWYEHCTDYALYKHWPKYCTNIVWMNHRPAIYHPNSAENIKLSIPIAYNVLSEFQSFEYASARFSFLCGLCLTEKKPNQMHPFKRDQPSLCLSCHACQPQKCVPLHGFRLRTVIVLVVFLYTKIQLFQIA
jgi:hypothetical protein